MDGQIGRKGVFQELMEGYGTKFWVLTGIMLFLVVLVEVFLPQVIPFTLFEFWNLKGSVVEVLKTSWLLFVWAILINLVQLTRVRNRPGLIKNAKQALSIGIQACLWAGIVEEVVFRWIVFYFQIIAYQLVNFFLLGFTGTGILEWIQLHISGPIVNFLTLGFLQQQLLGKLGWSVGAAMISSNRQFGNVHLYQGPLGWLNSWVIGMFLFFLMFEYGLFAAMLVHFLYDLFFVMILCLNIIVMNKFGKV